MTVVPFLDPFRPHIEVVRCRDRNTGKPFCIFDLVGVSRKQGPYRMDLAHKHTPEDVAAEIRLWSSLGYEVIDREFRS